MPWELLTYLVAFLLQVRRGRRALGCTAGTAATLTRRRRCRRVAPGPCPASLLQIQTFQLMDMIACSEHAPPAAALSTAGAALRPLRLATRAVSAAGLLHVPAHPAE